MKQLTLTYFALFILFVGRLNAEPIQIADIKRDKPVDFATEILPIFQQKCLACHNKTEAENDLVLENAESILKGGIEGPAIVAGNAAASYLFKLAAHQDEPIMPPEDNEVGAKNLTSEELATLKLWIDQGGKGSSSSGKQIAWQPLPAGVNPVYAVDVTPDGRTVAAGRANQVFLYDVHSKSLVTRLVDPHMEEPQSGVAHLDLVQSLAFSPDGNWLATGGYRTIKLWKREFDSRVAMIFGLHNPTQAIAASSDARFVAVGQANGRIKLFDQQSLAKPSALAGHESAIRDLAFTDNGNLISLAGGNVWMWDIETKRPRPLEIEGEVTAIAKLAGGRAAAGMADGKVLVFRCDGDKSAPIHCKGHSQPINSIAAVNDQQLATGSKDGSIRLWNVADGKQLRQFNPGGPVKAIAASQISKRVASLTEAGVIRLFNLDDGKQLAEHKSMPSSQFALTTAQLDERIAQRHVQNAEADLKGARDRLKQEQDNAKKSDEALKKADEELKKKIEEEKQKFTERDQAKKAVDDAKAKQDEATKVLATATETAKSSENAFQQAKTASENKRNELQAANQARQVAQNELKQARQAAAADPQNETLKAAAEQANKKLEQSSQRVQESQAAQQAAQKALQAAQEKRNEASQDKNQANQKLNEAKNAFTNAQKGLKPKQDAATKATNAKTAAEQTQKSSQRAVERAKESVEKASKVIPDFDSKVATAKSVSEREAAEKKTIESQQRPTSSLAFSSDGAFLLAAGHGKAIERWRATDGSPADSVATNSNLRSLVSTENGQLCGVTNDGALAFWAPENQWRWYRTIGSPTGDSKIADRVLTLAFDPTSSSLVSGGGEPSRSGELLLWDFQSGVLKKSFPDPHSDTIFDVEFSRNGKRIATCGADRFMKVFDVATGKHERSFEGHTHHVLSVSWRADDRMLATAGADQVAKIWNAVDGSQVKSIGGFGKEVTSIQFVGAEDKFVAACGDKSLSMCDIGGGRKGISGGGDFVYSTRASLDGKTIVFGSHDSVVKVVGPDGKLIAEFKPVVE